MESVMNFLSKYYIWFFVAAGVLLLALIGFIIESKKKNKNEFKAEEIDEANLYKDLPNNTNPTTPSVEPQASNNLEETMEINDIPTNDSVEAAPVTPEVNNYYGEAVMPKVEEMPEVSVMPDLSSTPQVTPNTVNIEPTTVTEEAPRHVEDIFSSNAPESIYEQVTPNTPSETPVQNLNSTETSYIDLNQPQSTNVTPNYNTTEQTSSGQQSTNYFDNNGLN